MQRSSDDNILFMANIEEMVQPASVSTAEMCDFSDCACLTSGKSSGSCMLKSAKAAKQLCHVMEEQLTFFMY
jgi:hypothetical protein